MSPCRRRFAPSLLLLLLASCRLHEPQRYDRSPPLAARTTRVLMIGDSLTYYNDLPGLLQTISARETAPIRVEQVTTPLASLKRHWNKGVALDRIRNGHFDYVILQEFSRKPVTDPEDSAKYFLLFDEEIRNAGGKTILFQNWTRRHLDKDYFALQNTYRQIQGRTDAQLAPIGAAWQQCAATRPDIKLLLDDRHPTNAGSYLAACVLYTTLYHKPAAALPPHLLVPALPPKVVATLRTIADRAATPSTSASLTLKTR